MPLRDKGLVITGVATPDSIAYAVAERALVGGVDVTLTDAGVDAVEQAFRTSTWSLAVRLPAGREHRCPGRREPTGVSGAARGGHDARDVVGGQAAEAALRLAGCDRACIGRPVRPPRRLPFTRQLRGRADPRPAGCPLSPSLVEDLRGPPHPVLVASRVRPAAVRSRGGRDEPPATRASAARRSFDRSGGGRRPRRQKPRRSRWRR